MSRKSKKKAPAVPSSASDSADGDMPGEADSRPPESGSRPAGWTDRWTVAGVCLFLAAITLAVFGRTVHNGFVNYDDGEYVYENAQVVRGLTFPGIVWAFTHVYSANWHPLTWISHMLDCQLYGLNPGGHHLTNILLHAATAILLFLVLRQMTGALWRSAFVAAVFAIHPLRVESVAWVAERKDVLSGVFFMLTIGAYVRYAQRRSGAPAVPALDLRRSTRDYGLVLLYFALGLMCKPMLVTLPLVLLLLDYWPLNRVRTVTDHRNHFPIPRRLILEKLPLFGLAAASCVVTLFAQRGAIQPFENISLPLRVGNALISYVAYMGQMFWPSDLAVLYPFTASGVGVTGVVLSVVVLAGISTGVFVLRRRPYLLTGWLWYLIMLVPVIGIVRVGFQARADRYTYLPQIGLYVLLTWAAADLCAGWRHRRLVLGGIAASVIASLSVDSCLQTAYWRDSELLWTHTLACTSDNFAGHNNLGDALLQKGSVDKAITQYQKALEINPDYVEAHYNLGDALLQKGNVDEAIAHFQKALEIKPDFAEAHYNLGSALLQKGKVDEAITHFQRALQINPDYVEAHNNLGNALLQKGSVDEAISHFQKALQINPDNAEAQNNLAWVLATCPQASLRNGNQAVELAQRANQLTGDGNPVVLGTLAAAYAEAGRFPEAVATAQRALQLAGAQSNTALADALRSQLKLYQAGLPFHQH